MFCKPSFCGAHVHGHRNLLANQKIGLANVGRISRAVTILVTNVRHGYSEIGRSKVAVLDVLSQRWRFSGAISISVRGSVVWSLGFMVSTILCRSRSLYCRTVACWERLKVLRRKPSGALFHLVQLKQARRPECDHTLMAFVDLAILCSGELDLHLSL
jgi:hypothetical protein